MDKIFDTQSSEAAPTWAAVKFHASDGCDVRHRTNRTHHACEDRMEKWRLRANEPQMQAARQVELGLGSTSELRDNVRRFTGRDSG